MLKTYELLIEELNNYSNPKMKIKRMVDKGEIFPIAKGLYETEKHINPFYLADPIYSPSYISFETALAYYDMIPERVYMIKSASFEKHKRKEFNTSFGLFSYQDIPPSAFPYGTHIIYENGYTYHIASKEKCLLDMLYSTSPIVNKREMREYLFENMRINELIIETLDKNLIRDLEPLYRSRNVRLFTKMFIKDELFK